MESKCETEAKTIYDRYLERKDGRGRREDMFRSETLGVFHRFTYET
jgi:hypothetical protein